MPSLSNLDLPNDGIVRGACSAVAGWIASDEAHSFERLRLVNGDGTVIPLRTVERPDVRDAMPNHASIGFTGLLGISEAALGPWRLRYDNGAEPIDTEIVLTADAEAAQRYAEVKASKLAAIRPLLRCALCRAALADRPNALICANGHEFGAGPQAFDFLTEDVRERVRAFATDNVSTHGYDPSLLELIAAARGPVLDVGAGLRNEYRADVVNVEIVPYPTTDVIAASEFLPFADESFDLVISVAVLEHVRDPFAAARELTRVVRPGGKIFAAVPFLQPYHGYPDHYYNMTAAGVRNLFPEFDVERLDVPLSGHPIFALTWMVKSWVAALPPEAARSFESLTLRDLAADPLTFFGHDFVDELSAGGQRELAALNVLVGRKRG